MADGIQHEGRMHYQYADQILACALPLPELPAAPADARPSLHIDVQDTPVLPQLASHGWQHDWLDDDGTIAISAVRMDDHYGLRFPDVAEAWVEPSGRMALWRHPQASVESLRHVLLDQVLPRVLAQRGQLVLHGSMATTAHGRTVVILGESGMGKSTLASAFELAGGCVLTDDCVVISHNAAKPRAVPSYAGLRLWSDSLAALYPLREAQATPVAHYSSKLRLAAAGTANAQTHASLALDAILVLQKSADDEQILLTSPSPQQACMAIIGNAFQFDLGNLRHAHQLLGLAAELARHVPVLSLRYPRDYSLLPNVVAQVNEHCKTRP